MKYYTSQMEEKLMKKIVVLMLLVTAGLIAYKMDAITWVKVKMSSRQVPYYQQRHEYFEKLSRQFYGVSDYAEELEAINRTYNINETNTDRVNLIIPGLDAIDKLKQRRTVVAVKNEPYSPIVDRKTQFLIDNSAAKANLKKVTPIKSSTIVLLGSIVLVSTVISLIGYFRYRQRKKDSAPLKLQNNESIAVSDDRILFEFDVLKYEEESLEPNEFYLKKVA